MVRPILSLLLIVCLLACPLRCAFGSSGESVVAAAARSACCCCDQDRDRDVPAPHVPADRHGDECTCQNCICEGATLQDAPQLPDSTAVAVFMCALPDVRHSGKPTLCGNHSDDRNLILGGRGMRIAHQSLLN